MIEKLKEIMFYYGFFYTLLAAFELGIIKELMKGTKEEDVAEKLALDPEGCRLVLEALFAIGLVERNGSYYKLKEEYREYVDPMSPFCIEPFLKAHRVRMIEYWNRLEEVLLGGKRPLNPDYVVYLTKGLFAVNYEYAKSLAERFCATNLLDVGCGSCVWSIPFALKGSNVVAIDFDRVIEEVARVYVSKFQVEDRYTFIKGDIFEVDWGGPYDFVILGNICHVIGEDGTRRIADMVKSSLDKEGKLLVIEYLKDGVFPYIFEINMYLSGKGRKVFSCDELIMIFGSVGLKFKETFYLNENLGYAAMVFEL